MSIRRLLVPVRGDGKGEGVLDHAVLLAAKYKAHVQVLNARPRPKDMMPFGVVVPALVKNQIASATQSALEQEQAHLKDLFETYAKKHRLGVIDALPAEPGKATISLCQEQGRQADWIGRHGRLADLVLVPRPDQNTNLGINTLQAALMNTGRPVMMCPPGDAPPELGRHIAFAWNGSKEASRAASLTLPMMRQADKVSVIAVVVDDAEPAIPADEFQVYLEEHGVLAEVTQTSAEADRVAQALLQTAADAGAECLVAGAYGQSRERELIFGGVTRYLIEHAEMPVVLVH